MWTAYSYGHSDQDHRHGASTIPPAADVRLPELFPINQPKVMIGNAAERFDAERNLTDDATKEFIRQFLQNLVEWTRRIRQTQGT
jgi:hypothetical protein